MINPQINQQINGYTIIKPIAQQKKSNIFLVEKDNEKYALKIFHDTKLNKRIINELKCLKQMDDPNVIKIVDDFQYLSQTCIVMEYCEGGTLLENIKKQKNRVYSEKDAILIFRELMQGVLSIHQKNIIHRNLKLENILFKDGIAKIGGFGISKELHEDSLTLSMVGTQQYLSPELALVIPYNHKIDVWSLGIILFAMIYHSFPFGCHSSQFKQGLQIKKLCIPQFQLQEAIKKLKNPQKISSNLEDLFLKIFQFEHTVRIPFSDMWNHPAIAIEHKCELPDLYQNEYVDDLSILMSKMPNLRQMQVSQEIGKTQQDKLNQQEQEEEEIQRLKQSQKPQDEYSEGMMLTSKLLALSGIVMTQSMVYVRHIAVYNFQIARYNLLIDQYITLKDNMKFNFSLDYKQMAAFKYFTLKSALFYMKWLDLILQKEVNEFNLNNFSEFVKTSEYSEYKRIVNQDIQKFSSQFEMAYEQVIEYDDLYDKEIKASLQPNVEVNFKYKYVQMPDGLKLPFRAVILDAFGKLYMQAQNYKQQKQRIAIQIDDMFERKRYSENEGKIRLKFCLRLLILSSINRIMEFDSFKLKTKIQKFEFIDFLQWLHKVQNTEEEIEHLFQQYFPQFDYKNPMSYKFK